MLLQPNRKMGVTVPMVKMQVDLALQVYRKNGRTTERTDKRSL